MRDQRAVIEGLESRKLMSAAHFYTSGKAKGDLIVAGDATTPNVITIQLDSTNKKYVVTHNGTTQVFPRAGVKTIFLLGGAADDTISVISTPQHKFTFPVKIFGRAGNDTLTGGDGRDSIGGGDGDDLIQGGLGNDNLSGDAGNDTIYGGFQNPVNNDGNDTLWGGDGDDTLYGGAGYDLMYGENGNDLMYGGIPNDPTNKFKDASDDMFGQDGNDMMFGGPGGRNRLHGMKGNDTLSGGPNNDTVFGGAGDNVIFYTGGTDLGERNGEWNKLSWFLQQITPRKPLDPADRPAK